MIAATLHIQDNLKPGCLPSGRYDGYVLGERSVIRNSRSIDWLDSMVYYSMISMIEARMACRAEGRENAVNEKQDTATAPWRNTVDSPRANHDRRWFGARVGL